MGRFNNNIENKIDSSANFGMGALVSKADLRDYSVKVGAVNVTSFELTDLPGVKNQSSVGSCVAHATSSILEWFNKKETQEHRELSTGFIYGMQGVEFNRLQSGMFLRDACKIAQRYGDCLKETVPFNIEMPECCNKLKDKLDAETYNEAAISRVDSYARCYNDDAIKYALMNYGPVLMGVKWYDSNKIDSDGVIEFDKSSKYGYHGIMVYGFNETGWLCQNSWGKFWGKSGRFVLPYKYGYTEAWSFVDAKNSDIYKPKRNTIFDIIYRFINSIINLFYKK